MFWYFEINTLWKKLITTFKYLHRDTMLGSRRGWPRIYHHCSLPNLKNTNGRQCVCEERHPLLCDFLLAACEWTSWLAKGRSKLKHYFSGHSDTLHEQLNPLQAPYNHIDKGLKPGESISAPHMTHTRQPCSAFTHPSELKGGPCFKVLGGRGQLCSTLECCAALNQGTQAEEHYTEQIQYLFKRTGFSLWRKPVYWGLYMAIQKHLTVRWNNNFCHEGYDTKITPQQ